MGEDILGVVVVTTIVIIPALAFTARFAIVPLLQALGKRGGAVPEALEQRVSALEAEVKELREDGAAVRGEVEALRSAEVFYRELQLPAQGPSGR